MEIIIEIKNFDPQMSITKLRSELLSFRSVITLVFDEEKKGYKENLRKVRKRVKNPSETFINNLSH